MKRLVSIIASICVFAASAHSESAHRDENFQSFSSVHINGNILATLQEGDSYYVSIDADDRILDYVNVKLNGTSLYIELPEKDFSNELKSQLRKRDNSFAPTSVTVVAPFSKYIEEIVVSGNTKTSTKGLINIQNLLVIKTIGNSSFADAQFGGKRLEILTGNNSSASVKALVSELAINSTNNSSAHLEVKSESVSVSGFNNSSITLSGSAGKTVVNGRNNSIIDALETELKSVEVSLSNNCQCNVKVIEALNVLSLVNGAQLIFIGDPAIKIGEIKNSSVLSNVSKDSRK